MKKIITTALLCFAMLANAQIKPKELFSNSYFSLHELTEDVFVATYQDANYRHIVNTKSHRFESYDDLVECLQMMQEAANSKDYSKKHESGFRVSSWVGKTAHFSSPNGSAFVLNRKTIKKILEILGE